VGAGARGARGARVKWAGGTGRRECGLWRALGGIAGDIWE